MPYIQRTHLRDGGGVLARLGRDVPAQGVVPDDVHLHICTYIQGVWGQESRCVEVRGEEGRWKDLWWMSRSESTKGCSCLGQSTN